MIFESISSKFQLKLKDRANAANILGEALKDVIKDKEERNASIVLAIPRGGVIVGDIIARFTIFTMLKYTVVHQIVQNRLKMNRNALYKIHLTVVVCLDLFIH
jgi:hypoxanthine phosphoribosyltransferase